MAVIVWAHRGASAKAPENTLEAFALALREGADGIETDVRVSADGRLVLVHDPDLGRIAGVPARVADLPARDLVALPLRGGGRIPLLEDLWDLAAGRAVLDLEIKDPRAAPRVVPFVRRGPGADVVVTSAHEGCLEVVRQALPGVPVGPVWERIPPGAAERAARAGYRLVSLRDDQATPERVAAFHAAGVEVHVWVVNDPRRAREVQGWGVEGVFTDDPGAIIGALGRGKGV